jgi:hypothetical protein
MADDERRLLATGDHTPAGERARSQKDDNGKPPTLEFLFLI